MKLYQGSCLDFLKTIPDKSVDLIVTDPPYDVSASNGGGSINKIKKLNKSLNDLVVADIADGYDIEKFNREFVRVMKKINIYIWCNKVQIPEYFNFYVNQLGCKFDILRWSKGNALPTYSNKYLSDTEFCLYFRKGGKCQPQSYEDAKTYFFAPINIKDKKLYGHPTCKPVDMLERLIRNSSDEGDIVLDPFMGSGSTGHTCANLNREFWGSELSQEFFNTAKNRIEDAYGEHSEIIQGTASNSTQNKTEEYEQVILF